jgi:hypothetical protein
MKANLAFIISALILFGLLVSIIVGTQTIGVSGQLTPRSTYSPGDPYTTLYYPPTEVPPPNYAKQPIVTILSPANDTVIATNNAALNLSLTLEATNSSRPITLGPVSYKASWMSNNVTIDTGDSSNPFLTKTLPLSIDLTNTPEEHNRSRFMLTHYVSMKLVENKLQSITTHSESLSSNFSTFTITFTK